MNELRDIEDIEHSSTYYRVADRSLNETLRLHGLLATSLTLDETTALYERVTEAFEHERRVFFANVFGHTCAMRRVQNMRREVAL